jgi:hypothetical protein
LETNGGGSFARACACSAAAHSSGVSVKGQKAFGQKRLGIFNLCGEGRYLDPGEPVAGTMPNQNLAILPRMQQLAVYQRVAVVNVVNGTVDFTIKAP